MPDDVRFLAIVQPDGRTENIAGSGMTFHDPHVPLEDVRLPQAIVGRNQPDVFAARQADSLVVVMQVSEIRFVSNVSNPWIAEGAGHRSFAPEVKQTEHGHPGQDGQRDVRGHGHVQDHAMPPAIFGNIGDARSNGVGRVFDLDRPPTQ